ncbi:UNVERIFIED_CONTAM: Retrovirus-related Pol polyprotein from transposon TNT 1-94 [Sesamum angustifolium]|uniref:Retrovirus-related Pol polyprotein from transposon TNT 1-94 n=1 Tax=Sesamum angustifolium TaxID=2727405 RepID=A0AAW2IWK1_9LAMI
MANQKRCDIQGLGDVCLTFSDGYKLTLRNVRYVPDLNHNLMSCAALEEEGLEGRWGKGIMKHKVQFPASQNPNPVSSSSILDYVHADVWGPSNISTHGGNKYFLSIIDNFSRKVFVFLMKHKSDVFENFRKWKILVENQTGKKLKVLRTDNGLEFCNQSFSNLCDECGIKRHKTNPYTPQQNGVAERMNRTLLEKVRCMLISSGLPKSFWGETLVTAAFLINRSPSVPLNGQIPESVWTGNAVDISSLRVFGCSAFVHQSVDKLAPRSQKCVFIGYPDGIKGLDDYLLARDRNRREPRIPARYNDFHIALNVEPNEPSSVEEALKSENSKNWLSAMAEEMKSLKDNNTWVLVPKPKSCSVVDCKWIFKIKEEDTSKRFKARLVAKGFTQKEGIDYTEIFSPVVKYTTVRIILALTAHFNWELKQMDVKTAFLHASHYQLSKEQCPKTEEEKEKMKNIPYSNAIGSIMFLMVCTRPDIAYSISCLSRYMSNAGLPHWEALKWLLRFLNGSANRGLMFSKCAKGVELTGYVDSNYANDRDSRRSTTSYIFTLCGSCITWKSQLQQIVALSTTEAEYIAATEAFKEALWLEGIVKEIGFLKQKITIFSDSQSAIQLCKNPVFHDRTKHIDVRNPLKNGDDDNTLTRSLDRFPETVLVQGGVCNKIWPMTSFIRKAQLTAQLSTHSPLTGGPPTSHGPDPTRLGPLTRPGILTYLFCSNPNSPLIPFFGLAPISSPSCFTNGRLLYSMALWVLHHRLVPMVSTVPLPFCLFIPQPINPSSVQTKSSSNSRKTPFLSSLYLSGSFTCVVLSLCGPWGLSDRVVVVQPVVVLVELFGP